MKYKKYRILKQQILLVQLEEQLVLKQEPYLLNTKKHSELKIFLFVITTNP